MNRWPFALLMCALCCVSLAGPTPAPVRAEIDALLARLQASGCEFTRNGSWYDGAQARAHLLRKLAHVEERTTLGSTEQFIELAATASSYTGRAYQVRCGAAAAVRSREWLTRELAVIRSPASGRDRP